MAFCAGEVVANMLAEGNTVSLTNFFEILENIEKLFQSKIFMLRLDSGYLSSGMLNCVTDKNLFVLCCCSYKHASKNNLNTFMFFEEQFYNSTLHETRHV